MSENKICDKTAKCPIYTGVLKSSETLTRTYKNLFCENGEEGRNKCKRYQVANIIGSCPSSMLPNSKQSVEEIIAKAELEKKQA